MYLTFENLKQDCGMIRAEVSIPSAFIEKLSAVCYCCSLIASNRQELQLERFTNAQFAAAIDHWLTCC